MPRPDRSRLYVTIAVAFLVGAACLWALVFFFGRVLQAPDLEYKGGAYNPTAQLWGVRGDAMGPFAALFNAGALVAALIALHLQRVELEENRKVLQGQQKELAATAEAQTKLAASQERLADAQERANIEAVARRLAQHGNTIAVLDAALAHLRAAELSALVQDPWSQGKVTKMFEERRQSIGNRLDWELEAKRNLLAALELGGHAVGRIKR